MNDNKKKFDEIRIVRPDGKLFKLVKKLASENGRTIGKQAEYMLLNKDVNRQVIEKLEMFIVWRRSGVLQMDEKFSDDFDTLLNQINILLNK